MLCILLVCSSVPFLRSWIISSTITLNCFSDRLPVSPPLSYFSGVSSCSFVRDIFLCHLIFAHISGFVVTISQGRTGILGSGVCPVVEEVGSGISAAFLVGGAGGCPGRMCQGCVLGSCGLRTAFGSLSAAGWGCPIAHYLAWGVPALEPVV